MISILGKINYQQIFSLLDQVGEEMLVIYRGDPHSTAKKDGTPITLADTMADIEICNYLKAHYPTIPILSEESAHCFSDQHLYWLIDPLDGTKEFINQNGEFTINVALIHNKSPILGIVYAPAIDQLFWGDIINGASMRTNSIIRPLHQQSGAIRFDPNDTKQHIKVGVSRSHLTEIDKKWFTLYSNHVKVAIGSSLKLCRIATGEIHCYPRFGRTCIWDIAAGHAILKSLNYRVREACIDSNLNLTLGNELAYDPKNIYNNHFVAY